MRLSEYPTAQAHEALRSKMWSYKPCSKRQGLCLLNMKQIHPLHARHRTYCQRLSPEIRTEKTRSATSSAQMSFRKRNIGLGRTENTAIAGSLTAAPSEQGTPTAQDSPATHSTLPGTRPSPVDGRLTTSTGTPTLDTLLAGHAGLALGHSIILEENGTTDYTGSLLKYYAAEGIVQGHTVHIVGIGEGWARGLPGLVGPADHGVETVTSSRGSEAEKMKIAWRYEKLGRVGEAAGQRGGSYLACIVDSSMDHFYSPQCMLTECLHSAIHSRSLYSRCHG